TGLAAHFDRAVAALESKLPGAAAHLAHVREDMLAVAAMRREVWRQMCRPTRKSGAIANYVDAPPLSAFSPTGTAPSDSSPPCSCSTRRVDRSPPRRGRGDLAKVDALSNPPATSDAGHAYHEWLFRWPRPDSGSHHYVSGSPGQPAPTG